MISNLNDSRRPERIKSTASNSLLENPTELPLDPDHSELLRRPESVERRVKARQSEADDETHLTVRVGAQCRAARVPVPCRRGMTPVPAMRAPSPAQLQNP